MSGGPVGLQEAVAMTLKRVLLVLVAAAMAADLLTFVLLSNEAGGISNEMNPVMVAAYGAFGLLGIALLKVGLATLLVLLVSRVHRPWMLLLAASIAIFFGLLGAVGNITAWLR
jgi:hypothetical protein